MRGSIPRLPTMPRRTLAYRKLQSLEDARKLEQLTAIENLKTRAFPDPSAVIPATGPEKMVFNYLVGLAVRFQFQYHEEELESTAFPEEIWIPDFTLPDYNIRIQVFGQYWHSIARQRESDLRTMFYQLYAGRTIIERGIPLYPSGGGYEGKYVIWWEDEVYQDLGFLFVRDLPELFSEDRISGQPEQYLLDRKQVERQLEARRGAMIVARLRPRVDPFQRGLKRMRRRVMDLNRIYPFLKQMKEDVSFKIKSPYDLRGRRKTR